VNNQESDVSNVVVLDANFILIPSQFHINYLEEIVYKLEGLTQFFVYQQVFDELKSKEERLVQEGKNNRFHTQFEAGKRYLYQNKNEYQISFIDQIKNENETTDEFLLRKTLKLKTQYRHVFLASNDYELRKKARKSQISVIYLRQKQFISIRRV